MCILIGGVAAGLDWTAIGPNRLRDRVASILYIPSFMGFFTQIGLAGWVAGTLAVSAIEWRVGAVMVGFVLVAHWIGAMLPPLRILGNWGRLQFPSSGGKTAAGGAAPARAAQATPATRNHINMNLVMHSAGMAIAMQLIMPGSSYAALVAWIATSVTTTAVAVGTAVGGWLGFK